MCGGFTLEHWKPTGLFVLALMAFATSVWAQPSPDLQNESAVSTWATWQVGLSYPEAVTAGGSVMIGRKKSLNLREMFLQGVTGTVDGGVGGVSVRVGWARLKAYDVGFSGWSYEAVYTRPWRLQWGLNSGAQYVGAGLTYHTSWFRLSGAVVSDTSRSARRVVPTIQAGVVFGSRQ